MKVHKAQDERTRKAIDLGCFWGLVYSHPVGCHSSAAKKENKGICITHSQAIINGENVIYCQAISLGDDKLLFLIFFFSLTRTNVKKKNPYIMRVGDA